MIDQIKRLERISRQLEPDRDERAVLIDKVVEYSDSFIESISNAPAYVSTEAEGRGLYDAPISEEGVDIESALSLLRSNVDTPGINPTSARFLGYVPGGALFHAALGDYLAAVTKPVCGSIFLPGPAPCGWKIWSCAGWPVLSAILRARPGI